MLAELPALLAAARSRGVVNLLTTHGLALKQSLLDVLADSSDRVRISFDGLEQTHNRIRGANVFQKALRTLTRLAAAGMQPEANITVLAENILELPALCERLVEAGAKKIVLMTLMQRESAVDNKLLGPSVREVQDLTLAIEMLLGAATGVRVVLNNYADNDDSYVVLESDATILLCSERLGDSSYGNLLAQDGFRCLEAALEAQSLSHRRSVLQAVA